MTEPSETYERGAGVLQAAEVAGAGQHDEHGGHAEQADVQVDRRLVRRTAPVAPSRVSSGPDSAKATEPDRHAAGGRQPHALDGLVGGAPRSSPAPSRRATDAVVP